MDNTFEMKKMASIKQAEKELFSLETYPTALKSGKTLYKKKQVA